jgi:outer membrane protein OmpA-like peptidoglycan-associated protein/opacity protein-like surface antigen
MKAALPLLAGLFICLGVRAQTWSPTLTVGASQYIGDIPDRSVSSMARGLVGGGLQYRSPGRIRLNLDAALTQLKASDAGTANAARNLSFTTWLGEVSLTGRFDLVGKRDARVIPYLSAGVALFYVNPWATGPNGQRASLYKLSTEGQGLSKYPGLMVPSTINAALPIGAGLDIAVGKRVRVDVEWILRKTFTDHIDDVSGNYPDRQALLAAKGPEAVALSWRGNGPYPAAGTARGNADNKDWYTALQLRFRWLRNVRKADRTRTPRKRSARSDSPVTREPLLPERAVVAKSAPDKDGDGVPDRTDNCPDVAGTAARNGCPVPDSDMDGVNDDEDACPALPGVKEDRGCPPLDRDKDGVPDRSDKCPDQPGTARFFGCPIPDIDKDGVSDEDDKCPEVPGLVELKGCPVPDQDHDGIEDRYDRCLTVPGIDSLNGCPVLPIRSSRVVFQPGTSTLTSAARQELDTLASWLLRVHPQLQVVIESHVDDGRGPLAAKKLSESRAMAVYVYLFNRRVPIARMQAVGVGSEQPVADNRTPQGRVRNNRVEFRLSE